MLVFPSVRAVTRHLAVVLLAVLAACGPRDTTTAETKAALERGRELARIAKDSADSVARWVETMAPRTGDVIDSALSMGEQVRRFRAGMPAPLGTLVDGAPSRDSLLRAFVARLAARDTAGLVRLALSAQEFIDLYYPASRYTAPPYEMSPQLVWLQIQLNSEKGLARLLQRVAGVPLRYLRHACPAPPVPFGPGRVWEPCSVTVRASDGSEETVRWFGGIFERDGRFKLVGFANSM